MERELVTKVRLRVVSNTETGAQGGRVIAEGGNARSETEITDSDVQYCSLVLDAATDDLLRKIPGAREVGILLEVAIHTIPKPETDVKN